MSVPTYRARFVRRTMAAALLSLVCAPGYASARPPIVAAQPSDICPDTADPCIVDRVVHVVDGTVLDFGTRAVEVHQPGRLRFGGFFDNELRCGAFRVVDGGRRVIARVRDDFLRETVGGDLTIRTQGMCSLRPATMCLSIDDCDFGACTTSACTRDQSYECSVDADCQLGGCNSRLCSNDEERLCTGSSDCQFGTCDFASRTCTGDPSIPCFNNSQCSGFCHPATYCDGNLRRRCSSDLQCDLGACDVSLCSAGGVGDPRLCANNADCDLGVCALAGGEIALGGRVSVSADDPGRLLLLSAGDIIVDARLDATARDFFLLGGFLTLDSRGGDIVVNRRVMARGGGGGGGGDIAMEAAGAITVAGPLDVRGGEFDGGVIELFSEGDLSIEDDIRASSVRNDGFGGRVFVGSLGTVTVGSGVKVFTDGHYSPFGFGGDGGVQEYVASTALIVEAGAKLRARGGRPDGRGGAMLFETDGDLRLDGSIAATSRGALADGGVITAGADGVLAVGPTGRLDASAASKPGDVFLSAGVRLSHEGTILATGLDLSFAEVSLTSDGEVEVSGRIRAGGSERSTPSSLIDVVGCSVTVRDTARIESRGNAGETTIQAGTSLAIERGALVSADPEQGSNRLVVDEPSDIVVNDGTFRPAATMTSGVVLPGCD